LHVPQFAGSFSTSTHLSAHCVLPPLHTPLVHAPLTHESPDGHFVPHVPQLFGSNWVTVHVAPHCVVPVPHAPVLASPLSSSGERSPHATAKTNAQAKIQSRRMREAYSRLARCATTRVVKLHALTVVD
jgi:hypothetical protein